MSRPTRSAGEGECGRNGEEEDDFGLSLLREAQELVYREAEVKRLECLLRSMANREQRGLSKDLNCNEEVLVEKLKKNLKLLKIAYEKNLKLVRQVGLQTPQACRVDGFPEGESTPNCSIILSKEVVESVAVLSELDTSESKSEGLWGDLFALSEKLEELELSVFSLQDRLKGLKVGGFPIGKLEGSEHDGLSREKMNEVLQLESVVLTDLKYDLENPEKQIWNKMKQRQGENQRDKDQDVVLVGKNESESHAMNPQVMKLEWDPVDVLSNYYDPCLDESRNVMWSLPVHCVGNWERICEPSPHARGNQLSVVWSIENCSSLLTSSLLFTFKTLDYQSRKDGGKRGPNHIFIREGDSVRVTGLSHVEALLSC